jgi:ubiquinone/menaquinone biosynthesis C-methylase UbiE
MTAKFVPALRYKWLTPFYDFFARAIFPEKKIKESFIRSLNLSGNETVLDFGCGTGTLCLMTKKEYPAVTIIGIDVDAGVLSIAENKIAKQQMNIRLEKYDGENIPAFEGVQFDKVISTLVFHHIPTSTKKTLLIQLYRLLKTGGTFHVADFGKASNLYCKIASEIFGRFDGKENTSANLSERLPDFIKDTGFTEVRIRKSHNTSFGTVDLIDANKP